MVVLIIAAVLGLLGKKALDKAKPAPERAIDQAQQTIAVIKEPFGDSDAVDGAAGATASGAATPGHAPGTAASGTRSAHRRRRVADAVSLTRTAPSTPSGDASTPRRSTGAISSRVSA